MRWIVWKMMNKVREFTQYGTHKFSFLKFVRVWAKIVGWTLPAFHEEIIHWLENHATWTGRTGVLQIARNHAKSTLVGLFVVWKLTQNPTLRFLIVSEKRDTATKMVAHVRSIIVKHPLAQCLYNKNDPNSKEMWRGDSIKVLGHTDPRSPSVVSLGIRSGMTGWRADFIIGDDLEGPTNTATPGKREKLRAQMKELVHIIEPTGSTLFIGTPHCEDSIYPELIGKATATTDEDIKIIGGVSDLFMAAFKPGTRKGDFPNMTGEPLWKERMGVEVLLEKQRATGKSAISKGNFYSQYLLIPYRITNTILNSDDLRWYDKELTMDTRGRAWLGDTEIVGQKVFWDPAFGQSVKAAGSAVAIILQDDKGNNYAHWVARLKKPDGESMDLQEQCQFIISLAQAFHFRSITIESNGPGSFTARIFRKEAVGKGIACIEQTTEGNKIKRILDIIEPRLNAKMLHTHERMRGTPFQKEFDDFNTSNQRLCDTVDAFASAIELQPIRITAGQAGNLDNPFRGSYQKPHQWERGRVLRESHK